MKSFFGSEFFAGNRKRLRELFVGTAPIVLTGNSLLQRNGDMNYEFRQDSSFWYLTGVATPDAVLVMDKDKVYLILPDLSPNDEIFGVPHDYDAIRKRSGIELVMDRKEGWKQLMSRVKRVKHIATLSPPPSFVDAYGMFTNPARAKLTEQLKEINETVEFLDLRTHLTRLRMLKQEPELQALQKAIDITIQTLKPVSRKLQTYEYEFEIEADVTHGFRSRGALGHAFWPVIAGGKNTCHLHHTSNNDTLAGARLIYLDVGAEVEYYAADITRTFFLKRPTKRERAVYDAVKAVQSFAISNLKPGISIRENEEVVEQMMGEKLRELVLIKNIDHESVRKFYPHATSHHLGLDAHDAADYDRPLEPGMVLTVEPGIYIKEEGLGVRIEDDVMITEKGCKVLSSKLK